MLVFRAGIHKLLVRIANWEASDQTASSEQAISIQKFKNIYRSESQQLMYHITCLFNLQVKKES